MANLGNRLAPRARVFAVVLLATSVTGLAACGRSGSSSGPSSSPGTSSSGGGNGSAGTFGSLTNICGHGDAKGTPSRGVSDTEINLATFSDTGNTIQPGLEQEFFDTGDAFVQWCNDAGGINGRKIVLHKRDAKLFNSAAVVIDACQTDFMEVGGGTALDDATVKPRLRCNLGDIPAYHVSPAAVAAPLQVEVAGAPVNQAPVGGFRALTRQNPSFKDHTGMYANNLAALLPQARRSRAGLEKIGYKISDFQEFPQTVATWRPYLSVSKNAGSELIYATGVPSYNPFYAGMTDIGFTPKAVLLTPDNYKPLTSDAFAAATNPPPTYMYSSFIPYELSDTNPVVKQAVDILTTKASRKSLSAFNQLSLSAWLLWAKSATECGSKLTVDCVLQKAAAHPDWDSGGVGAPFNTDPKHNAYADCILMLKTTKTGFEYDKELTKPTKGLFNCEPENTVSGLPSFQ